MAYAETSTLTDSRKVSSSGTRHLILVFWAVVGAMALAGSFITDSYLQHVLILCFLWCMVAAAWDLALGFAGIFNYAQLVFFAAGAYAAAMLALKLGVSPLLSIAAGSVIAGVVGLLVGLPCLRLKGEYVALFTFAVHLAMPPLIQQTKGLGSGGTMGLFGVPPIASITMTRRKNSLPRIFGVTTDV